VAQLSSPPASPANIFPSRGDGDPMFFFSWPRMRKVEDGCAHAEVQGTWAWLGAAWRGPGSSLFALDAQSPHEKHLAGLESNVQGKREAQPC